MDKHAEISKVTGSLMTFGLEIPTTLFATIKSKFDGLLKTQLTYELKSKLHHVGFECLKCDLDVRMYSRKMKLIDLVLDKSLEDKLNDASAEVGKYGKPMKSPFFIFCRTGFLMSVIVLSLLLMIGKLDRLTTIGDVIFSFGFPGCNVGAIAVGDVVGALRFGGFLGGGIGLSITSTLRHHLIALRTRCLLGWPEVIGVIPLAHC